MNFFKKLFGSKSQSAELQKKKNPDNTKLIYLLDVYSQHRSDENYKAVVLEILQGNSFLMLPTINDPKNSNSGWQVSDGTTTLKITSIFDQDGLKVLGAFSDQKSLLSWAKQPTTYTSLASSAVIEICEQKGIGRIVINSGQKNIFVLQRNKENLKEMTIAEGTEMYIGTPARPLDKRITDKLVRNFRNVNTVEEVYYYLQVANKEASFVLGIKMSVVSDNSKTALFNAVNDALRGEKTEYPIDIMILDNKAALQRAQGVNDSLFYKK